MRPGQPVPGEAGANGARVHQPASGYIKWHFGETVKPDGMPWSQGHGHTRGSGRRKSLVDGLTMEQLHGDTHGPLDVQVDAPGEVAPPGAQIER